MANPVYARMQATAGRLLKSHGHAWHGEAHNAT